MRKALTGLLAMTCGTVLSGCHPTAADSPGANPIPPADAPSDASTIAPAEAPSGSVSAD
jgi:hypothetical protein